MPQCACGENMFVLVYQSELTTVQHMTWVVSPKMFFRNKRGDASVARCHSFTFTVPSNRQRLSTITLHRYQHILRLGQASKAGNESLGSRLSMHLHARRWRSQCKPQPIFTTSCFSLESLLRMRMRKPRAQAVEPAPAEAPDAGGSGCAHTCPFSTGEVAAPALPVLLQSPAAPKQCKWAEDNLSLGEKRVRQLWEQ